MPPHPAPQHPESDATAQLLQQAIAHHQAGALLEAGQLYQTILQTRPDHPEANHNLGMIAVQAQQPEAGLPYFMAALDADPTRGQYWLNYIDALFQAGQLDDAQAVLALARQQGLQGEDVEALALRLDGAGRAAPVAQAPMSGDRPGRQEMDALVALFGAGRYAEVVTRAQQLTAHFPRHEFAWKILGVALKLLGREREALEPMRQAAALSPQDVETHYNLGVTLQALGHLDEAEASYRQALEIDPVYADAYLNLGVTLNRLGRPGEAEERLRQALLIRPGYADAHSNLGAMLQEQGRLEEAEACLRKALQLAPDNATVHDNLGITLHRLGRPDEAEASFRRALRIQPGLAAAHTNLGVILQEQGRLSEADAHFQMALQLDPEDARTHDCRGSLLSCQGRLGEAEASYRKALQIVPQEAGFHVNLGKLLRHVGRLGEAEACLRRALEISPDDPKTLNHLGLTLQDMGQLDQAEACYRCILQAKPNNAGVIGNLGQVLLSLGRPDEAEACFRQALQIKPDHPQLHSNLLYYLLLNAVAEADAVFAEHVRFGERFEQPLRPHWPVHAQDRDPGRPLHIGFVSADFYNHAVASFIEPVLAHLAGHAQLTLHAYYNNFVNDEITRRLQAHFDHWNPVASLPDAALAETIRADGIDILIDLSGHTAGNRLLVFARKPAPVQVTWMGYPGTTGMRSMDYCLGDRFFLPPGQLDAQFTEKIVRLPANSPYLPAADAPPVGPLPALDNGCVTFGSFSRSNKLSPRVVALWAQVLRALPDARMLLAGMPETGNCDVLIQWFEAEGIARDRLSLHARCGMQAYLDLHRQVDICLDTFPYNGGTTTLHALWMGVPTLTLAGDTAAGRSGASILGHAGLDAFVARDAADFMKKGVSWSGRLAELAEIRAGLRERFAQSARGQPALVAAGVERALRMMWQRWCAGLPAESFEVSLQDTLSSKPEASA